MRLDYSKGVKGKQGATARDGGGEELENGPAGERKSGWEKGCSSRWTIRRPRGGQRGVGVGTVEISEYQKQAKSKRKEAEASGHWL